MRGYFSDRSGYSKPNVLILIILAILIAAVAWWFLSERERRGQNR